MMHSTDPEWRTRLSPTGESDVTPSQPTDDRSDSVPAERSKPTDGGSGHRCPICEFVGGEYDEVYAHLLTAHRKRTIGAALLRT